jgi:hypothetical protein
MTMTYLAAAEQAYLEYEDILPPCTLLSPLLATPPELAESPETSAPRQPPN